MAYKRKKKDRTSYGRRAGILGILLMSGLCFSGYREGSVVRAVPAQQIRYGINIGAETLSSMDGKWNAADGLKLYYGQYEGTPTEYRILAASAQTQTPETACLLLDADTVLDKLPFHSSLTASFGQASGNVNEWTGSDLQAYLGRRYEESVKGEQDAMFSQVEAEAVAKTVLAGSSQEYNTGQATLKDYASTDRLFLLSAKEVKQLYADNASCIKNGRANNWWLRSASARNVSYVGGILLTGEVYLVNANADLVGLSPALNVALSDVIFSSASTPGSGFIGKSGLLADGAVNASADQVWKLTLKDGGKKAGITYNGCISMEPGETVTVPYTYTDTNSQDPVSQISVMVTDKDFTKEGARILYYGALQNVVSGSGISAGEYAGTGEFTLPGSLPQGYRIYILAECVKDGRHSDYAGDPVVVKHSGLLRKIEAKEPGCTTDGNIEYWLCDGCGRKFSDSAGYEQITGDVSIKATGHLWNTGYTVDAAPTAETPGQQSIHCSRCDAVKDIVAIPALGMPAEESSDQGGETESGSGSTFADTTENKEESEKFNYVFTERETGTYVPDQDYKVCINGELEKFVSLWIDGLLVDRENYTLEKGPTVILLRKEFMQALSAGQHMLTVNYIDGAAHGIVIVPQKAGEPEEKAEKAAKEPVSEADMRTAEESAELSEETAGATEKPDEGTAETTEKPDERPTEMLGERREHSVLSKGIILGAAGCGAAALAGGSVVVAAKAFGYGKGLRIFAGKRGHKGGLRRKNGHKKRRPGRKSERKHNT